MNVFAIDGDIHCSLTRFAEKKSTKNIYIKKLLSKNSKVERWTRRECKKGAEVTESGAV